MKSCVLRQTNSLCWSRVLTVLSVPQKRVIQVSSLTAQFSEPYVSNDRLLVTLESKVGPPCVALLG